MITSEILLLTAPGPDPVRRFDERSADRAERAHFEQVFE